MGKNILTFIFASKLGAMTDISGRKPLLIVSIVVSLCPILVFAAQTVLMDKISSKDPSPAADSSLVTAAFLLPNIYFVLNALTGVVSFMAVLLACCGDATPKGPERAAVFGCILALFLGGIATSPFIDGFIGNQVITVLIAAVIGTVIVPAYTFLYVSETVTPAAADEARRAQTESSLVTSRNPFSPMKILLRNKLFINLTMLIIFTSMASEAAQTMLLYYVDAPPLNFTETDSAELMLMIGFTGILMQAFMLKPLVNKFGEKNVLILSSVAGSIHMLAYAVATTKAMMFVGGAFVCITVFAFPCISAIKSNNAAMSEQGMIQGAVFSVKSLASAIGPTFFTQVYKATKDSGWRGEMWLCGVALFAVSIPFMIMLPVEQANSNYMGGVNGEASEKLLRVGEQQEIEEQGGAYRPSSIV